MPNMDPSLVLLYECVKSVDWKEVGKALGVNALAARARYNRFEAKMKSGGIIKSDFRATPKKSEVESKPRTPPSAARKRAKRADSESGSATSSIGDKDQSESEEPTVQRQTRGLKQDLKSAFDSSNDDTESSFDDYDETAQKNETDDDDDDLSDTDNIALAKSLAKNPNTPRRFRRSGSPPTTPGRYIRSKTPTVSPLTPASIQKSIVKRFDVRSTPEMSYDDKIKKEVSVFRDGMMLSFNNAPSTSNKSRKHSAGYVQCVQEADILQSIECDEEPERENFDFASEEMGDIDENEDEDEDMDGEDADGDDEAESIVREGAMGPPAVPDSKKMSYFQWVRTAVNRSS